MCSRNCRHFARQDELPSVQKLEEPAEGQRDQDLWLSSDPKFLRDSFSVDELRTFCALKST